MSCFSKHISGALSPNCSWVSFSQAVIWNFRESCLMKSAMREVSLCLLGITWDLSSVAGVGPVVVVRPLTDRSCILYLAAVAEQSVLSGDCRCPCLGVAVLLRPSFPQSLTQMYWHGRVRWPVGNTCTSQTEVAPAACQSTTNPSSS